MEGIKRRKVKGVTWLSLRMRRERANRLLFDQSKGDLGWGRGLLHVRRVCACNNESKCKIRFDILAAMKLRLSGTMKEARATNYINGTRFRGSNINFGPFYPANHSASYFISQPRPSRHSWVRGLV